MPEMIPFHAMLEPNLSFLKVTHIPVILTFYGSQREKTCLREFANNKVAEQSVHSRLCCLLIGKYHIYLYTLRYKPNFTFLASLCS